jgi:hypothetical protein
MKNYLILLSSVLLMFSACKLKKEEEKEKFFPVLSFIKSQVANVDTSLYAIKKIIYTDSLHSDTTYLKREDFRTIAKDFLDIPDITDKKNSNRFVEERSFDETMNRVILSYKPKDPDKEELQTQEVLIAPDIAAGDKVTSIIIEQMISDKNGFLQKNMLWQVDQSFQVTTILQKPGQPETITTLKVTWNEKDNE